MIVLVIIIIIISITVIFLMMLIFEVDLRFSRDLGATRGVTVSMSAFLACHQC